MAFGYVLTVRLRKVDAEAGSFAMTGTDATFGIGVTSTWMEEDFSAFDTYADVQASSYLNPDNISGPAAMTPSFVTGLTGTPWGGTKALRYTWISTQLDVQGGVKVTPPLAATDKPREVWLEWYYRFDTAWETDGQWKYMFYLQDYSDGGGSAETNRWDILLNETYFQGSFPGTVHPVGTSPEDEQWFDANLFDNTWHRNRWHLKMSSDDVTADGESKFWLDDWLVSDGLNQDMGNPDYSFFRVLRFGANGKIQTQPAYYDLGYFAIYTSDPGW